MDQQRNLIFLKGEDKTGDISFCRYNPQTRAYDVTFNNGRTYHYARSGVVWLTDPVFPDPGQYHISRGQRVFNNIRSISVFGSRQEWWHITFENGRQRTYPKEELTIRRSCLEDPRCRSCLSYLHDIAGLNDLKNDDGEVLLQMQYEALSFVDEASVLACYLNPEQTSPRQYDAGTLIFPFGGNASQFQAVRNALSQQLSVIQGPPGTGKTQTILNILANLLIRDKTVQVVSNNNSATENVLEKLASPKYGLDFLVAALGNRQNKEAFVDGQTGVYPNIASWRRTEETLAQMEQQISWLSMGVSESFSKQERMALAKQELRALDAESRHFSAYYDESGLPRPRKSPRRGLKSASVLRILREVEAAVDREKPLSLWLRLKATVGYGIFEWSFPDGDVNAVISCLQSLFYRLKKAELQTEIGGLQAFLAAADAKAKMDCLTSLSMEYLRAILFKKYGARGIRPLFSLDETWKNPQSILEEYPIVLSTTFSSRSCLKDAVYDYLIMDEASQVDLATGALALASAQNAVIVGDLKQLPNVVPEVMLRQSEALFHRYQLPEGYHFGQNSFLKSVCTVIRDVPQTLLREHYRCHPKIIGFCNQKFYHNQLVIMTEDQEEPDTLLVYKTVMGSHHRGHLNQRQIDVTMEEVLPRLRDTAPEDIGIIAPYRAQVQAFSRAMGETAVEVDTVHKFQGREKDAIVITTVDDRVTDFSDDPYLLNVAISRAKKKLCLVVSGEEQPLDSNVRDLISYIQYHSFDVVSSEIYSVFDLLYQQYTRERLAYLAKRPHISQYDSENLMYAAILELLRQLPELTLGVIAFVPVRMLLRDTSRLTEEERRYALHPQTHVDFLIYNLTTKAPVLAIEVDGFRFHSPGTDQARRDLLKNAIFEKYRLSLLRFATNGSGEIRKIREYLLQYGARTSSRQG